MIANIRHNFNLAYNQEKFQAILDYFQKKYPNELGFKLSESPIFLSQEFKEKLISVSDSIIQQIMNNGILEDFERVPAHQNVPNCNHNPHFFAIDFGICQNNNQEIEPQLIELQAFPSLFYYQIELAKQYQEKYPLIEDWDFLMQHNTVEEYHQHLNQLILGNERPENTILLELYPEQQKTKIDFTITNEKLGIETVCLTKIKKEGKRIYYVKDGKEQTIKRIYNRLIFDDLDQYPDLETEFKLTDNVDVEWITHPNWFFVVSKALLPKLQHQYIPDCYLVNDFPKNLHDSLQDFVLKPLFSFAGQGVNLNPTKEDLAALKNPNDYILQQKVSYAPIFKDVNGDFAKAELRLLYTWLPNQPKPEPVISLVRMTKSNMVNVSHNQKTEIYTGSSVAFFKKI